MKVRIISKNGCPVCLDYLQRISQQKEFSYEIYDGDKPENQDQLDKWKITNMPVVQIIEDSGELIHQFLPGGVSFKTINHILSIAKTKTYPKL